MAQPVIVVGGGLAGLCASLAAASQGSNVVLLDKQPNVGGNSAKASSGMNASVSSAQKALGIEDSVEHFYEDTIRSGRGRCSENLVRSLTERSADIHAWLESLGINLSKVSQCGGHSAPRTHREPAREDGKPAPIGWDLVSTLKRALTQNEQIANRVQIVNNATVIEVLFESASTTASCGRSSGQVVGVKAKIGDAIQEFFGCATVVTTGGFGCDHNDDSLLAEFAPHVKGFPTTNGNFATGDGVRLLRSIGCELVDMDQVQLHPSGFINPKDPDNATKILAPEALRAVGGMLFDSSGRRFVNELSTRDTVSLAINSNSSVISGSATQSKAVTLVLTKEAANSYDPGSIAFYVKMGLLAEVGGLQGIAQAVAGAFGTDESVVEKNLEKELQEAANCFGKNDRDSVGRSVWGTAPSVEGSFYVGLITPSIHYTMGGVKIDPMCRPLRADDDGTLRAIPRLFAAGEVTGGVHGCNRLAGNSLLECAVFGRLAGMKAASCASEQDAHGGLDPTTFIPLEYLEKSQITEFMWMFKFALPSPISCTGMQVGQYISVRMSPKEGGDEIVRYYSPISRPNDLGTIELLVKVDDKGVMSKFLSSLKPGEYLDFKGPMGGLQLNPLDLGKIKNIGMIAGGAGISPMLQIVRAMRHRPGGVSRDNLRLMYGNLRESEIVCREHLDAAVMAGQLDLRLYVNEATEGWKGGVGFINADEIKANMYPPSDDTLIVVCGPPGMCKAIKQALNDLGYSKDQYFSFM